MSTGSVHLNPNEGPLKPKSDNSIFECRVLSRHHAHIWYEDEQIWVKDKGSSNGTFVNGMKVTGEQVSSEYLKKRRLAVYLLLFEDYILV